MNKCLEETDTGTYLAGGTKQITNINSYFMTTMVTSECCEVE